MKTFISCSMLSATLILAMVLSTFATPEEDLAFSTFVENALKNYSTWLLSNNLEPTPLVRESVNLSYVEGSYYEISGEIKNQVIFNHSRIKDWQVEAELDVVGFNVFLELPQYRVIGEYNVNARIDERNVSGSGWCVMTAASKFGVPPLVDVVLQNFTITPEGYVDLDTADLIESFGFGFVGEFEGLDDDTAESLLGAIISANIYPWKVEWCPLDDYLVTYLKEVFATTAYADIIGGKA